MIKIAGYTSREIQQATGASQQQVSAWARTPGHRWQVVATLGRTKVYAQDDVADFFQARKRRNLLRRAGWSDGRQGQGLIWYDDLDRECPRCGGFAIEKPATREELDGSEWLPIFCENCGLAGGKMWWIVWQQVDGNDMYAVHFDHEPTNEDIASSSSWEYNMVGYPVEAENEAEAIEKAEASEDDK
jgi:hypothetical protein